MYIQYRGEVLEVRDWEDGVKLAMLPWGDTELAYRFLLKDGSIPPGSIVTHYEKSKSISQVTQSDAMTQPILLHSEEQDSYVVIHSKHVMGRGVMVFDGTEKSTRSGTKVGRWEGKDEAQGIEFTGYFSGKGVPVGSWKIVNNGQEHLTSMLEPQEVSSVTSPLPGRVVHPYIGQTYQELQKEYEHLEVKQ